MQPAWIGKAHRLTGTGKHLFTAGCFRNGLNMVCEMYRVSKTLGFARDKNRNGNLNKFTEINMYSFPCQLPCAIKVSFI